MVKVALIDIIGLTYDGNTLSKRGLGGSESAIILMSKELVALGFDVTVFNNCIDREAQEGVYDGVKYIDHSHIGHNPYDFDVVISSRTVFPFAKEKDYGSLGYNAAAFKPIVANAKLKVVWLHDTFCQGDHLLEQMLVDGDIDEIFTLSDFHTSYVSTCDHGRKRMQEVIKRKMFQTRNGATLYPGEVDIAAKDHDLFVYNASVTKGMVPLVNLVWPLVKRAIPTAKLTVIGGYYRFRENAEPDEQEKTWRAMVSDVNYEQMGITFTGIIKQSEIAKILKKASFMLYPPAFPETFGISSLESLMYNTPLITARFGALEETAVEQASYFIDYPATPNGLYPWVNEQQQAEKIAHVAVGAWHNTYLHQQKMYYCNVVKGIHGWDSVALQWKQHFYKKLGEFLSVDEYRKVSDINARVHQVYGRRFGNPEEIYIPRRRKQRRIVVVTPTYNSAAFIGKCIDSVATQDYDNWCMVVIDDATPNIDTWQAATDAVARHPRAAHRIDIIRNDFNKGAVRNHIETIREYCDPDDIVMLIDGDDWLVNDNQIFQKYNNIYDGTTEFTYGSCWSIVDNIPLIAQPYPEDVKNMKAYRRHKFNWNMPYTHLRTFKAALLPAENHHFQDENGNWFKAGGDTATFYTLIERAEPSAVKCIPDVVYMYNDAHPLNDYKVNGDEQTKTANAVLNKKGGTSSQFTVTVPTMWRCPDIFKAALTGYVLNDDVGEIIIINNDVPNTPEWDVLDHDKIRMMNSVGNFYVNPSWNLGVAEAENEFVAIVNDDIVFDPIAFPKIRNQLMDPQNGIIGMIAGEADFGQPVNTDCTVDFKTWTPGDNLHGFGQAMFVRKDNWVPIKDEIKIYFGDDYAIHAQLMKGKKVRMMYNINQLSPRAQTSKDTTITAGFYDADKLIFDEWFYANPIPTEPKPAIGVMRVVENSPGNLEIWTGDKWELFASSPNKEPMKTILIAIPTNKYIEPETMKSIYDLEVPDGYTTTFQYFFGYQVDQIRNLIASWAEKFDYLFAVDSDMSFAPDTLKKLLAHNVDVVSGLYIQRKPGQHILEIYRNGRNVPYQDIKGQGLVPVDGCGFGCVLVKSDVIRAIGYPQFVYKSALDHANTVSEDTYFCLKAKEKGYKIWADTTIQCGHHGASTFYLDNTIQPVVHQPIPVDKHGTERLWELNGQRLLPAQHVQHLHYMKSCGHEPKVIYDIGACVLHWTNEAVRVWPEAEFVVFEAMPESEPIFQAAGLTYNIGVLSDEDGKELTFYQNTDHPGGNSYYKENVAVNPEADAYFNETHARKVKARTVDALVAERNLPLPDLIKMDVQGAELDVLKGAANTLQHAKDLILELQKVEYNKGAPLRDGVIEYLNSIGFVMCGDNPFCDNGFDGDYQFTRL